MKIRAKTTLPAPSEEKKKGQLKWVILTAVLAVLIGGFTVTVLVLNLFGSTFRETAPSAKEAEVVLTMGEYEVTYDLYSYLFLNHKARAEAEGDLTALSEDDAFKLLNGRVLSDLAGLYATLSMVKEVSASESDVTEIYDTLRELTRSGGDFAGQHYDGFDYEWVYYDMLKENRMTDRVYRLYLEEIAADYVAAATFDENAHLYLDLSEDAVRTYFRESEDVARVTYAYISFDSFMGNKEAAREVATAAYAKLVAAKDGPMDEYTDIEIQYSPTAQAASLRDGFYLGRYDASEANGALVEAIFAMEVDEISDVIETDSGLFIVRRLAENTNYIDDVANYDSLETTYKSNSFYRMMAEKEATLLASAAFSDAYKSITAADIVFPAE